MMQQRRRRLLGAESVLFSLKASFSGYAKRGSVEDLRLKNPGLWKAVAEKKKAGHELSFCWITPRALARGLEGPIMARLLSNSPDLMLVGARMYRPTHEFVDEYEKAHISTYKPRPYQPFVDFLNRELRPSPFSVYPNALLMLLFTGPDCRAKLTELIGVRAFQDLVERRASKASGDAAAAAAAGETPAVGSSPLIKDGVSKTIRGSFGEVRQVKSNTSTGATTVDFEPALVTAHSDEANEKYLRVFAKHAESSGGSLVRVDKLDPSINSVGMVMIKPDALNQPSARIGHVMDLFSSTGLNLIGASIFSMSVGQAREFYGFLEGVFEKKMASKIEKVLKERIGDDSGAFDFEIRDRFFYESGSMLKRDFAKNEVNKIISYMTGEDLKANPAIKKRGKARCLALLYQGPNAIETIRTKLGNTNPDQAQPGTIRAEFGDDIMRNTAHASDSFENLQRECKIIRFAIGSDSSISKIIDIWFASSPSARSPPSSSEAN